MPSLVIILDPEMQEGSLYEVSAAPSQFKCENGLYLHKVMIKESQKLVNVEKVINKG
jgi:hypothetical protein